MIDRPTNQILDHRLARLSGFVGVCILPLVVVGGVAGAAFVFQPFGDREFAFATVAGLLGLVVLGSWFRSSMGAMPQCGCGLGARRSLRLSRRLLIGALASWLALVAWSSMSTGGVMPPAKSDSRAIRVLTWNILRGRDRGVPWDRRGWTTRKKALAAVLDAAKPEIFCVQEALSEQVGSIAALLPEHTRVGVGRSDGRSAGEHCAIYYDSQRFAEVKSGTFWLEEPTEEPPSGFTLGPKRICTWARLLERASGRYLRVYNTHLYLTEKARQRAVRIIVARIASGDATDAILVAGDFNAAPHESSRRLFEDAGLVSSAELAGTSPTIPTYHFYGIHLRALDDVYCSRSLFVQARRVLDVKPGNTYPSDHFGVMADIVLRR
jgi:endonuclease/exonuclease/phosphatase family metal-dependent hydrolase